MSWTLVTGGAKNLGATIAIELARLGYNIVIHYRSSYLEAQHVVSQCSQYGVNASMIQGDFSSWESTQEFIQRYKEQFSDTSHLINNVGNYLIASSLNTTVQQWYDLFQTNLHTPYLLTKALLPSIKERKGSIINIGVVGLNSWKADTYSTVYTLAKAGLLTLTRSLARELASEGVRVNMVSPGHLEKSIDLPQDLTKIPMQRPGKYSEVADLIAYLLSNKAQYITGQNIEIAGGTRL